jgi:hypothetical protein
VSNAIVSFCNLTVSHEVRRDYMGCINDGLKTARMVSARACRGKIAAMADWNVGANGKNQESVVGIIIIIKRHQGQIDGGHCYTVIEKE